MSVILEFSVAGDEFSLGRVLSGPPNVHLELERVVPTGEQVKPFVWVTGSDFPAFEEMVRDDPSVDDLVALDKVGDSGLYRIEWVAVREPNLIDGISTTDGTVLEASGNASWTFRLRFPDHERLARFYDYCTDHDIGLHIDRTNTLHEGGPGGIQLDLSRNSAKRSCSPSVAGTLPRRRRFPSTSWARNSTSRDRRPRTGSVGRTNRSCEWSSFPRARAPADVRFKGHRPVNEGLYPVDQLLIVDE